MMPGTAANSLRVLIVLKRYVLCKMMQFVPTEMLFLSFLANGIQTVLGDFCLFLQQIGMILGNFRLFRGKFR